MIDSNYTYQTLYQNEIRNIELSLREDDETIFIPTSGAVNIYDEDDSLILSANAIINSNVISYLVNTTITETTGEYQIIWKINKNNENFYHKTILKVLEL